MQTSFQRRLHSHLAFSIPLVPVSHQAGVLRKRRYSKLSPFHHHHRLVFLTCMKAGPTNSTPEYYPLQPRSTFTQDLEGIRPQYAT